MITRTEERLNQISAQAETDYIELITSANNMLEKYAPAMIK
jgi:hypothetical protein